MQIDQATFRSPNYSDRPAGVVPDMIVLHDGEGTKASDLAALCNDRVPLGSRVSAHYYVDRAGHLYELVDPKYEAWHAGKSAWAGRNSLQIRNTSIGIESEHRAGQLWPDVQRAAYADLCRYLIARFPIRHDLIAAHRWIAPGRKFDPTDWPDAELRLWIADLYIGAAGDYRARAPMWISETPSPYGPIALKGLATVRAGDVLTIDEVKAGWAHLASKLGFVPLGGLERIP